MDLPVMSGKQISLKPAKPMVAGVEEKVTVGTGIGITPGATILLPSNVTAPVRPIARPVRDAPVPIDTEAKAKMSPTITAPVPTVAEAPTCQTTLAAEAPLINSTLAPTLMVNAEPTWKTHCAFALPCPSNVRVPPTDKSSVLAEVYVPALRINPAS